MLHGMEGSETMIDESALAKIRNALKEYGAAPFRSMDLAVKLGMNSRKLAFMLRILQGLGEVRRFDVRVELAPGFRVTRSFWRKTA